ncbi:MFS transporter [Azomonas macrocytogenes]|nr:MFS transporter [Azomonas macrocytogenes]
MPGSPSTPLHPPPIRAAYALGSILLGITGGLGNALVTANLPYIQGDLGLTPSQGAWLTASYLMVNVSANLVLVKFRQQFGLVRFAEIGLSCYAVLTLLHVFVNTFSMAVAVRAASGFAGATLTTLATLYMLQAFRKAQAGKAQVLGVGVSQLATPLAWVLSPPLRDMGEWHRLYIFESGLALCSLAFITLLKLPPGIRIKAFEWMDALTIALLAPALALIAAVVAQGRIQWWFTQPWIGYSLVAAIVLLIAVLLIERNRHNPLIQTRWLGTIEMLRFTLGAIMLRFLLSEQTFGAVGLLQYLGMNADQLQALYTVILLCVMAGIGISALIFSPQTQLPQIVVSIVLIGIASFLDSHSSSLTRPHDMYFSQGLLALASGMFFGPLMLIGFMRAVQNGANYLVSFTVLFALTQSLGGLAGPALFGTFETVREKYHSSYLVEQIDPTDPRIAQRLQLQGQVYGSTQGDPVLRQAMGSAQFGQIVTREANVLAFNDVFRLIGLTSTGFLCWSLYHTVRDIRRKRQTAA